MKKTILYLTVHRQWFDLIAKGIKKREFRMITTYWYTRLCNHDYFGDILDEKKFKKFDEIHIRNGYRPDSPFMRIQHIKTDLTPPKLIKYSDGTNLHLKGSCYQIHLGDILELKNYPNPN